MSLPAYDPVDPLPPPARDPAGPLVAACSSLALAGLSGQPRQPHQLPVKEVGACVAGRRCINVCGEGVRLPATKPVAHL